MISREETERLRGELLAVLQEDAHNAQRLLSRLEAISRETGIGAHAALLMILTHLGFDEESARHHWARILEHRQVLSTSLARDVGVRVAVLDYFVNVNRQMLQPTLIDLELLEADTGESPRDRLTGLATDRLFRTTLQHELRRARRYSQKAAVALFDIDDFAEVNQRFGDLIGDRLLREAAIVLSNKIRDIDLAGRPGEDEFALLLPETDRNGALLVAERYRSQLQQYFAGRESGGQSVGLTVSAGVACYPDDATAPEDLLERAAQALYQAKAGGKNAVQLYRPERRRYLRFELEPGRFEVEVLAPAEAPLGSLRNLSRNGILFLSPEPLEIGEKLEIRLADVREDPSIGHLRIRGTVVRLEELPETLGAGSGPLDPDRFEVGVAFDLEWGDGTDDLLAFLESIHEHSATRRV